MKITRAALIVLPLLAALGGCRTSYILSAGDGVGPSGGEAPVFARLERCELPRIPLAVKEAPIQFVMDGQHKASFTDEDGYAGAAVAVPKQPGVYRAGVFTQDAFGVAAQAVSNMYAWPGDAPVLVVDADCIPASGAEAAAAKAAVAARAAGGKVLYMTREAAANHPKVHQRLASLGCPDGPVLIWQMQWWRSEPMGRLHRVVLDPTLVGPLAALKKAFPNMQAGICGSSQAAKAMQTAGIKATVIRASAPAGASPVASWAEIAGRKS